MSANKNGTTETTMAGAALFSTILQIQELGSVGKDVLKRFGIKEIDLNERYSYRIRGAIHTELHKRYGDDVLFFLGYTQLDGYKKWMKSWKTPAYSAWARKNRLKLGSSNIKVARSARDKYLNMRLTALIEGAKGSIFSDDGAIGGSFKKMGLDQIEVSITNACLPQFEVFNRGNLVELLTWDIGAYWNSKIVWDPSRAKSANGWSTFFWNIEFVRNKTRKSSSTLADEERKKIRDRFIVKVLEYTEKQRINAEKREDKVDMLAKQLARYIPPQIHSALMSGNYNTDITTRRKKLTIFFSDIKNFTSTSEGLQPEDLTKYLNEYFSEMTRIALEQGATIDKYIGDAVMLFFGDPDSKGEREDARACVEMALRMQERMVELRDKWRNDGFADPFQIRIGLNTGYCNVGNFGSEQRLTYTIIGGEVNVAARLESAADANSILMSYETYAHAQDMVEVEEREAIQMKGINREIKIFSIKGRKQLTVSLNNDGQKKLQNKDITEHKNFETKDNNQFSEALQTLQVEVSNLAKEVNALKKNRQ